MGLKVVLLLFCTLVVVNGFTAKRFHDSDERRTPLEEKSFSFRLAERDQMKTKRSEGNSYESDEDRHSSYKNNQYSEEKSEEKNHDPSELDSESKLNHREREGQTQSGGQKFEIKYSYSSEENSKGSQEVRRAQREYHNTNPENSGNGRLVYNQIQPRGNKGFNFEPSDIQDGMMNTIEKDM